MDFKKFKKIMLQYKNKEVDTKIKNIEDLKILSNDNIGSMVNLIKQDRESLFLLKDHWKITHDINNGDRKA